MTLPKNRSTSVRRVPKRTPKGKTVHYVRRAKGKRHSCAVTGARLQGVDSTPGLPKSSRRPNRKFGGELSSSASSRVIAIASRVKEGSMKLDDVDIRLMPYVKEILEKQ